MSRRLVVASVLFAACQPTPETGLGSETAPIIASSIDLIAIGTISGNIADLSDDTADPLENGVPGNQLGGLGSGLAYAGWNTFLAVPDRGPNAVSYNAALDDTASYINRFETFELRLRHSAAGAALPFELTPELVDTTLLHSRWPLTYADGAAPALNDEDHTYYFTGRSDNFDPAGISTDATNARLDPEGIRVSRDGSHVYISDEYGPHIYEFNRWTGSRTRTFELPSEFAVANQSPQGAVEISGNTSGRVANKGMEGLAITPDGHMLVGAMQSPLLQDGGTSGRYTRIVTLDLRSGEIHQYAYGLTNIGTASKPKYPTISEIVAVDDHEFLVDERDGKGLGDDSVASYKKLYLIDLDGAQDVTGLSGEANLAGPAVAKTLFLDIVAVLTAHGIAAQDIPAKIEGLAFGPDVVVGGSLMHTLFVTNDNDFIATVTDSHHPAGADNPNRFFVFAIDPALLPGFEHQRIRGY
jgi:hypothetical protein